jgi:glycosyltransferase involved in cell wall biosynthesis
MGQTVSALLQTAARVRDADEAPPGRINVVHFQRRPLADISYSLETYFENVRAHLPVDVVATARVAPHASRGVWRRVYDAVWAAFRQGDVNHVTGDVHYVALLLRKRRTMLTVHDCAFLENPSRLRRAVIFLFWYKLPLARVAAISVVSEFTRRQLTTVLPAVAARVSVIPTGVSDAFQPAPRVFAHPPTILHVGTSPNKNLPRLMAALAGIPCTLHIVGRLGVEDSQALRDRGIVYRNSVNLSTLELVRAYEECDLLAFCSTFEGFGMPIVEAQRVGRPVVTSNVASMPEVAGGAACLVDPLDILSIKAGLERVISDEEFRTGLVARGLKNAERFTLTAIASSYATMYRRLAGRGEQHS